MKEWIKPELLLLGVEKTKSGLGVLAGGLGLMKSRWSDMSSSIDCGDSSSEDLMSGGGYSSSQEW